MLRQLPHNYIMYSGWFNGIVGSFGISIGSSASQFDRRVISFGINPYIFGLSSLFHIAAVPFAIFIVIVNYPDVIFSDRIIFIDNGCVFGYRIADEQLFFWSLSNSTTYRFVRIRYGDL